jgi:7-cyano-7-deazaguanine synthase
MTDDVAIEMTASGLPSTFVPGRNLLFFTYAAALAYRRNVSALVGGMCETDYSGYPDCRHDTLQTLARALSLGLDRPVVIETPLMRIDKAGTWALAEELGGQALVDLVIEDTHTCYLGDRTVRHAWGFGCGTCPACELRSAGWSQWQARRGRSPAEFRPGQRIGLLPGIGVCSEGLDPMSVLDEVIRAIDLALAGDWQGAHAIAQRHEGDPLADWLHAVLHRIEGDDGNARYWYREAGRDPDAHADPRAELAVIRAAIASQSG